MKILIKLTVQKSEKLKQRIVKSAELKKIRDNPTSIYLESFTIWFEYNAKKSQDCA